MVKFDNTTQETLEEFRAEEEEDLARMMADKYGVQYVNLSGVPIDTNAMRLIPENTSKEYEMVAFDMLDNEVDVAARIPSESGVKEMLEKLKNEGYQPTLYIASRNSLQTAWKRYEDISYASQRSEGLLDISRESIAEFLEKVDSVEKAKSLVEETLGMKKAVRITRIVEIIIATALALDASDIHVEPRDDGVKLRMRIDGVMRPITALNRETYELLLSRIKILSGLKLNITDESQDGRFTIELDEREIEVRTSALPGPNGETIVLRVLDPSRLFLDMGKLGMNERLQQIVKEQLDRPNGVILNTGPTGSGKTTTLYAFLSRVNKPRINIITIENPIEYHLEGATQTQVNTSEGYSFFEGLTAALRQDPDIIMVGEIRENETAKTVIHAGLTGHLVFSTLHTNNAAGAFPRLIELGIEPDIMSSAINMAMAQRLVRKLCPDCKQKRQLGNEEKETISDIFDSLPDKEAKQSLWPQDEIWTAPEKKTDCTTCGGMGYKGRIGVFEAVLVDEYIEETLRSAPTEREVREAANQQGLYTMTQDGIVKVLNGVTDIEELRRVIEVQ